MSTDDIAPRPGYRRVTLDDLYVDPKAASRLRARCIQAGARPLGFGGVDVAVSGPDDPAAIPLLEWLATLTPTARCAWCAFNAGAELETDPEADPERAINALRLCCTDLPETGWSDDDQSDLAMDAIEDGLRALGASKRGVPPDPPDPAAAKETLMRFLGRWGRLARALVDTPAWEVERRLHAEQRRGEPRGCFEVVGEAVLALSTEAVH